MRSWVLLAAVLGAGVLFLGACGGGGGGGPPVGGGGVTTADVGGTWLGPAGMATPAGAFVAPATPGSLIVDGAGGVTTTGAFGGLTGTLSDEDPAKGILNFTGTGASAGVKGIMIFDLVVEHALFIASDGTFSALQREGVPIIAPPFLDTDYRSMSWSGVAAEVDAAFDVEGTDDILVGIDAAGVFNSGDSGSNALPLALTDPAVGTIQGDYLDPTGPESGNLLLMITADRTFIAVLSCEAGSAAIDECNFAVLTPAP